MSASRRVDEQDRQAAEIQADLDRVSGRAGNLRDDRDIAAGEGIEEG